MGLKLITAPVVEPLLVSDASFDEYIRIDGMDSDNNLKALIKAARVEAESYLNRALINQTWELTLDKFPDMPIKLPKPPLVSVGSFKYIDYEDTEITWAKSNYIVDTDSEPGRIALAYSKSLPGVTLKPINGVKIQFQAGYGSSGSDVPENFLLAMKLYVTHRFEHPDDDSVPEAFYNLLGYDRVVPA
jgi:uncharacterized phiE125 gp8 family phage protein